MQKIKTKKIIVGLLIFGQLSFLPSLAFAQLSVPTSNSALGSGDILGTSANLTAQAALAGVDAINNKCILNEQASAVASTIDNLGFSGLAIIGGDKVLVANLTAVVADYNTQLLCRTSALAALRVIATPNVYTSNLKQRKEDDINLAMQGIKNRKDAVQARLTNAKQGFWKTLVFNILIKTSKSVATTLVGKLVNNYKIRDYKQYADSIATLVYDNQFIRENYPDNQGQMMARAMLTNPLFRKEVPTALFMVADAALGFDPKTLNTNDPSFYTKMASVGSAQANPYFIHNSFLANTDLAHSNALTYSQNQISQSQGLKTPVNCAGSLAQQKAIDAQTKALDKQWTDRKNLYDNLMDAKELGMKVSDSDIAKAKADLTTATTAWNNAPDALPKGTAALTICEAIVSPPSLINKGIDEAFKAIGVNLAQYNENNLPSFMNIIGDVASQIGTNFVLGGAQGAKSAVLLNEGRLVNAVTGAVGDYVNGNVAANLSKGVTINFDYNSSVANTYSISWDIITEKIANASFVTVVGDGLVASNKDPKTGNLIPVRYPISGTASFTTTKGGMYVVTVYDSAGRALTSANESLSVNANTSSVVGNQTPNSGNPPPASNFACGGNYISYSACVSESGDASYCSSICGGTAMNSTSSQVAGAFTQREPLNIRGSAVHISPRGE